MRRAPKNEKERVTGMSDILKAIKERSSTRGFQQQKPTKEELDALICAGLQAPTAANRQEIHISVADGSASVLAEIEAERTKGAAAPHNFYYEAPVVMILSGDAAFRWTPVDAGIAAENICLAAEGLGLGSLIIGCIRDAMEGGKKEHFAKALKFPEGYEYQVAVAVGYKAVTKEPHTYSAEKNVSWV